MASPIDKLPAELLELSLWFLPFKDLLYAQRVSQLWHQLISGSTKLQIVLFRAPQPLEWVFRFTYAQRPAGPKKIKETRRMVRATARDAIGSGAVHDRHDLHGHNGRFVGRFNEERYPVGVVNGCFFDTMTADDLYEREREAAEMGYLDLGCTTLRVNSKLLQAMRSTSTSWREMYVTQPPIKYVSCHWKFQTTTRSMPAGAAHSLRQDSGVQYWGAFIDGHLESNLIEKEVHIQSDHGVTAGQVADKIRELQDETGGQLLLDDGATMLLSSYLWISEKMETQLQEQDDNSDDGEDIIGQDGGEYYDLTLAHLKSSQYSDGRPKPTVTHPPFRQ